jgi:hypothetical protein
MDYTKIDEECRKEMRYNIQNEKSSQLSVIKIKNFILRKNIEFNLSTEEKRLQKKVANEIKYSIANELSGQKSLLQINPNAAITMLSNTNKDLMEDTLNNPKILNYKDEFKNNQSQAKLESLTDEILKRRSKLDSHDYEKELDDSRNKQRIIEDDIKIKKMKVKQLTEEIDAGEESKSSIKQKNKTIKELNIEIADASIELRNLSTEAEHILTNREVLQNEIRNYENLISDERIKGSKDSSLLKNDFDNNNPSNRLQNTKLSNESEDDYLTRLHNEVKSKEFMNSLESQANLDKNFIKRLKEIDNRVQLLYEVSHSIKPEFKLKIIDHWPYIKQKFIEIYGVNNKTMTSVRMQDFLRKYESIDFENLDKPISTESSTNKPFSSLTRTKQRQIIRDEYPDREGTLKMQEELGLSNDVPNRDNLVDLIIEKRLSEESQIKIGHGVIKGKDIRRPIDNEKKFIPQKIEKTCQIGKIHLFLNKLVNDNQLSVKKGIGMASIRFFHNIKVSNKFVDIIVNILENKLPTLSDINSLSDAEKTIYDRLIHIAEIHKSVINQKEITINRLMNRIKLIEGEIDIGNDNKSLLKELRTDIYTLYNLKEFTKHQLTIYLNQYKNL